MADAGHESKYLNLGKRMEWAADPEHRRFARKLVLEGNGPKKIAVELNKRFGLTVNGNSLGGFIHSRKGDLDGPTWFLNFLSDEETPATPVANEVEETPAKPKTRTTRSGSHRSSRPRTGEYATEPEPLQVEFNYEEYLAFSTQERRHAPGNGPLGLKAPRKSKE